MLIDGERFAVRAVEYSAVGVGRKERLNDRFGGFVAVVLAVGVLIGVDEDRVA